MKSCEKQLNIKNPQLFFPIFDKLKLISSKKDVSTDKDYKYIHSLNNKYKLTNIEYVYDDDCESSNNDSLSQ